MQRVHPTDKDSWSSRGVYIYTYLYIYTYVYIHKYVDVSRIRGTLAHNKDSNVLGSTIGCPYFGKLPHIWGIYDVRYHVVVGATGLWEIGACAIAFQVSG